MDYEFHLSIDDIISGCNRREKKALWQALLEDDDLLTAEERRWLNEYHQRVYEKLSPRLDDGEQEWLRRVTKPL